MTQEEKQLLLKDLSARLPYGVIANNPNPAGGAWDEVINIDIPEGTVTLLYDGRTYEIEKIKPYLRPMSSMTEEEREEESDLWNEHDTNLIREMLDFYCSHHLDWNSLIPKGLALEAPNDMYKTE